MIIDLFLVVWIFEGIGIGWCIDICELVFEEVCGVIEVCIECFDCDWFCFCVDLFVC